MKEQINNRTVRNRLKGILLAGVRGTALYFGELLKSQDIRKQISDLRKDRWDIKDRWLKGRKEYWLNPSQISELKEREKARYNANITKD